MCHIEKEKSRSHLTYAERCKIEAYSDLKVSQSEIARRLGRAKSTISEEREKHHGVYKTEITQKRVQKRKSNSRKTKKLSDNKLQHYVIRKLKDGWSPEIVAHVWNSLNYEKKVGCTCIYNFINQRRIELIPYKNRYKSIKAMIPERVGIEERPKIINDRYRVGDLEIDTQREEVKRL